MEKIPGMLFTAEDYTANAVGKITEKLKKKRVLVSDGSWGTYLVEKGLPSGECPELWNITHREIVLEIAASYVNQGVDLLGTNSFGGSRIKLDHYGLGERAYELNRASAEISREAAGSAVIVMGSIGPTGKILMMGDVTEAQLYDAFAEQAIALEEGGADAACIETMSDIEEALCAIKAVKENTRLEIICTFTFEKTKQEEFRTMMGVTPTDMAQHIIGAGAGIIGANCGNGMEYMIPVVRELREYDRNIPLLVHANAGMPILKGGETCFCETPADTAKWVPELIRAGADIIGGCCGTTTAHIKAIRDTVIKLVT